MIHLVNYENKALYSDLLDQMHVQRKTIFMDKLSWELKEYNGREIDEFDTDDSIYLIATDPHNGKIKSSARLNPTVKSHLMSEYFEHYCENGVPRGENIYEITRYCYNPDYIRPRDRFDVLKEMICGVTECSLLYGWEKLTLIQHMPILSHCLASGWDMSPLGLPHTEEGLPYAAFEVNITQEVLQKVRKSAGITKPILKIVPYKIAA